MPRHKPVDRGAMFVPVMLPQALTLVSTTAQATSHAAAKVDLFCQLGGNLCILANRACNA